MAEQDLIRDPIGDRMKRQYEDRTRYFLPRRTYTIIRIDGKAFHTFTRQCEKPFDAALIACMDAGAVSCCQSFQGCKFAYGQSDEYSFLLTDFEEINTEAWFDGNLQKIVSVAASTFTAAFNDKWEGKGTGKFDCRVFTIPDPNEVENYFIWRQQDAVRNSIQSLGQAHFSPKQLHKVTCDQIQELLFNEKGINWNDLPDAEKRGRGVFKVGDSQERFNWQVYPVATFTADRRFLKQYIPRIA